MLRLKILDICICYQLWSLSILHITETVFSYSCDGFQGHASMGELFPSIYKGLSLIPTTEKKSLQEISSEIFLSSRIFFRIRRSKASKVD